MDKDKLRALLAELERDPTGCWLAPAEVAEEVRLLLGEHTKGKPTRGKRPEPFCQQECCVFPEHQELTEEKRALRIPRTCGECAYVRFKGPQLITLEEGTCNRWRQSERLAVRSDAEGCPLWTRRSKTRRKADAANQHETAIFVDKLNQGIRGKKRR